MRTVALITFILVGAATLLWFRTHDSRTTNQPAEPAAAPIIDKQPPVISTRRFDPASPPPDMPPLYAGEQAECDSNFTSTAQVSSRSRRTNSNQARLTVAQIKITLQLSITIWVPNDVTQKVLEHEQGHQQIAESYYQTADQLARKIAASYMGKEITITSDDLEAEANKTLQQMGAEITTEYNKQLNPDAAQLRYDAITDHARNDIQAKDAVAQSLKE